MRSSKLYTWQVADVLSILETDATPTLRAITAVTNLVHLLRADDPRKLRGPVFS